MNKIIFNLDTKCFSLETHPNKLNIDSVSIGKNILIPKFHTESGFIGHLKSSLRYVFGNILTYIGSGSGYTTPFSLIVNRVLAMKLVNKAITDNWSLKKLCQECLKSAKTAQNVGTVTMTLESGFLALLLGTTANIPLWVPLLTFGLCISLGLTLGRFLTKRGFIRYVSAYLNDKFMPEINKMMAKEKLKELKL